MGKIACGGVDRSTMKKNHLTPRSPRTEDSVFSTREIFNNLRNQLIVNRPNRMASRSKIMPNLEDSSIVAARNKHQ